jgi:hypothetical protein
MINTTGNGVSQGGAAVRVYWYDEDDMLITASEGNIVRGGGSAWYASGVTATAPAGAATAKFGFSAFRNSGSHNILVDACTWDYAFTTPPNGLIFKAVQTNAGFSANTEPTWPTVLGNTVVDNQVTWEAVLTTRVTYEAHAILVSGSSEPTWPTAVGANVPDNTIIWQGVSGVISDTKCPNTTPVAIAASKVFAGDVDIISFSATINPLDWSTTNDAGYLPFGLQTYGSQPVAALGLYRSNLVAFNATGFQMWQVDQDPANMALLDAVPISCTYPRTVQPIGNDLAFLNAKGVRNVSIAGASTNLQADGVGQPIDSLVQPKVKAGTYTPIGLYWPFAGQYWLLFGPEAFVLTINGVKARSWSRYVFPEAITDWTLDGNDLILRTASDKIWRMDSDVTLDDVVDPISVFTAGGAPLVPEAIHVETDGDYVSLPSVDDITDYTVTGWARVSDDSAFRTPFAESGNPVFPQVSLAIIFLYPSSGFELTAGGNGYPGVNLPDLDRWFFWCITNTGGVATGRWCYLEDSSFDADNTASGDSTSYTHTPDVCVAGAYGDSGGIVFGLAGDFTQFRRWTAELTELELLAEKDSSTAVRDTDLWSSNPFTNATDMTDESGNGNVGTPHGSLTDVTDGPGN